MRKEKLKGVYKKIVNVIMKPEMRVLPGQLAYFFVLSLIPLIALLGAIASKFSIPTSIIGDSLSGNIPKSTLDLLLTATNTKIVNLNFLVFLVAAFVLASNGTHSMIVTSNEIYRIKSDNYIKRRVKAIGMTIILVVALLFVFLLPLLGDSVFTFIKDNLPNKVLSHFIYNLYQVLKYPISIIIIYANIKLLYMLAPDKKIRSKTTTKGALFTTISWILTTKIYTFYVGAFAKYDVFYGSISNIIILLLWIYLLSYIFVLGMAFNAGFTKEEDIERTGMILSQ